MANRENLQAPANQPQAVTWWLANYYPTDSDGEIATIIGTLFKTYDDAVSWGRAQLATEGVGVVYISLQSGYCMYPLFVPEAN